MGARSRKVLALVAALAVAPALAGCLGVAQASAMEHRNEADARAKAWSPDAELARIVGVEGSNWMGAMAGASMGPWGARSGDQPSYWARAGDDERVGDGRCEIWVYQFVAEGKAEKLVVVADRDGNVVAESTERRDDGDAPVGEWRVDSDEAAEIAMDRNDGLREGLDSENYGLVLVLQRETGEERARWRVMGGGGDESGGGGGIVILDAVSGKVLSSHGGHGAS